jgi:hypothetical protein
MGGGDWVSNGIRHPKRFLTFCFQEIPTKVKLRFVGDGLFFGLYKTK